MAQFECYKMTQSVCKVTKKNIDMQTKKTYAFRSMLLVCCLYVIRM